MVLKKIRKALNVLAQPGKTHSKKGKFVIQPFRGYGARREAFLMGRVFKQHRIDVADSDESIMGDLAAFLRRMSRKGLRGARISAEFYDTEERVESDKHGFFKIRLKAKQPLDGQSLWHPVQLRFTRRLHKSVPVQAYAYFPPDTARFVVISDIDDTIIHTGVANKIKMLWRLFIKPTESRTAFPGVPAFYRALHSGGSGVEFNPMLYVSRGPWAIYEILDEFFNLHRIPVGPILFLRHWGFDIHHPLPHFSKDHKVNLIRTMLWVYKDLPIVLIGDSGQKDPEIYAKIVSEHPGRVLAVYIRDITRDPRRRRAIEKLGRRVLDAGSHLVVAEDSFVMAGHAAKHGYISSDALSDIMAVHSAESRSGKSLQDDFSFHRA